MTWEESYKALEEVGTLEDDWDGNGAEIVPAFNIEATHAFLKLLEQKQSEPPHCIYATPDGHTILEWQYSDDTIRRIETICQGHSEEMISYPSSPPNFFPI